MTYLRALGEMLLRMSVKDSKKGRSYLDLSLDELFSGNGDKGIDGLVGEVAELHEQIIDHIVTGKVMDAKNVDDAINECYDVCISSLLVADWLRARKAEFLKRIEEGTEGFCPVHKIRLELHNLVITGTTKKKPEFVCPACLKNEVFE